MAWFVRVVQHTQGHTSLSSTSLLNGPCWNCQEETSVKIDGNVFFDGQVAILEWCSIVALGWGKLQRCCWWWWQLTAYCTICVTILQPQPVDAAEYVCDPLSMTPPSLCLMPAMANLSSVLLFSLLALSCPISGSYSHQCNIMWKPWTPKGKGKSLPAMPFALHDHRSTALHLLIIPMSHNT